MTDHSERSRWPLPPLAVELDDLVASIDDPSDADANLLIGARWAAARLAGGAAPRDVCEAATWFGLRRDRTEGYGSRGSVSRSVLAAHSCASLAPEDSAESLSTARLAAAQHVAYTVGGSRNDEDDRSEAPVLQWLDPGVQRVDPVGDFLDAVLRGDVERSDRRWVDAATADPDAAEEALISAGAAGYHLNEDKLIYPAQLRAWTGQGPLDPALFRAAARYAGNHLQDRASADAVRADAEVLAVDAVQRSPSTLGRLPRGGHERVSTVASGIALTPTAGLARLVLASLEEGLSPEDLIDALALLSAAAFAITSFGDRAPIGPVHACTGADALQRCLDRAQSPELRYELALCATRSPNAEALDPVAELWVPPFDDGAVDDLLVALGDGDPDAASEAATAVPPDEPDSVLAAWSAVRATAATDQWMMLHAVEHTVAMEHAFRLSDHPARIWFLAAAARTAAHATAVDQPVAALVAEILR